MKKTLSILDKIEDTALIFMFIAMVGAIFLQVVMRFAFNNSSSWSEELGKFLFVWLSWLGISIGHRKKEHIKITMLVDKLPEKFRLLSEAFTEIVLIAICGVTLYYGIIMIGIQWSVPYAGIKISTSWGYLSLVVGCGLFILRAVIFLVDIIRNIRNLGSSIEGGGV